MKTAVSVPDPVFKEAEKLKRKLRVSRSQLYSRAVESYVKAHRHSDVTRRWNEVLKAVIASAIGRFGFGSEADFKAYCERTNHEHTAQDLAFLSNLHHERYISGEELFRELDAIVAKGARDGD